MSTSSPLVDDNFPEGLVAAGAHHLVNSLQWSPQTLFGPDLEIFGSAFWLKVKDVSKMYLPGISNS